MRVSTVSHLVAGSIPARAAILVPTRSEAPWAMEGASFPSAIDPRQSCLAISGIPNENRAVGRFRLSGQKLAWGIILAAGSLGLGGCLYDVPITAQGTRKIDDRLIGHWSSQDGKDKMQIVKLDGLNCIILVDGKGFYRAYHSDLADKSFMSVQILHEDGEPEPAKSKYAYWCYSFSADGVLHMRQVNDKLVPDSTADEAGVQKLLKANLQNPDLLGDEEAMSKDK